MIARKPYASTITEIQWLPKFPSCNVDKQAEISRLFGNTFHRWESIHVAHFTYCICDRLHCLHIVWKKQCIEPRINEHAPAYAVTLINSDRWRNICPYVICNILLLIWQQTALLRIANIIEQDICVYCINCNRIAPKFIWLTVRNIYSHRWEDISKKKQIILHNISMKSFEGMCFMSILAYADKRSTLSF